MTKHIINNGFPDKFEQEVYRGWAEKTGYVTNAEKYIFKNYLSSSLKTIEAGTGGGRISFYLEKEMNFDDIIAFDLVPQLIERCEQRAIDWNSKVKFIIADVSNLNGFNNIKFDNILYTGQVLSMLPEQNLQEALLEAHKLGHEDSSYIFTFMDWDTRWYNFILSLALNSVRFLKNIKMQWYYIPEVRQNNRLNQDFFNKNGHSILWIKTKHAKKRIEDAGFTIKSCYSENQFGRTRAGAAIFFVCSKNKSINN
jgi:hypothetical protein